MGVSRPLLIDLFCGLGGFSEGFLAAGWRAVGFDTVRHVYGDLRYPGELVLQDVLTLHGSQFRDADLIVASPPCQSYSWLAMPWSRSKSEHSQAAKALRRKWETEGPDNRLFDACFRIQGEASAAAGRHIPMVVENVRGAQEWVGISGPCADIPAKQRWRCGRSRWHHGSFHLWGDVPALMPVNLVTRMKYPAECSGRLWKDREVPRLNDGRSDTEKDGGVKIGGDWFSDPKSTCRKHGSRSQGRRMASAKIAKIPPAISEHFAEVFRPASLNRMNEPERETQYA